MGESFGGVERGGGMGLGCEGVEWGKEGEWGEDKFWHHRESSVYDHC